MPTSQPAPPSTPPTLTPAPSTPPPSIHSNLNIVPPISLILRSPRASAQPNAPRLAPANPPSGNQHRPPPATSLPTPRTQRKFEQPGTYPLDSFRNPHPAPRLPPTTPGASTDFSHTNPQLTEKKQLHFGRTPPPPTRISPPSAQSRSLHIPSYLHATHPLNLVPPKNHPHNVAFRCLHPALFPCILKSTLPQGGRPHTDPVVITGLPAKGTRHC
jgi:hypothetical protein